MKRDADTGHVDLLLALSLVFGEAEAEDGPDGRGAVPRQSLFSSLDAPRRQAVARRAEWQSRLPPPKQGEWLAFVLSRARAEDRSARFDEHIHPSHVVEALRAEPPRVRALVTHHLPPTLASAVTAELGGDASDTPGGELHEPAPEVVDIVRREFLSRFVSPADLTPTPLELLTGAELARLVRLLGVRETAVACRGIEEVEAVASFLRRFAPEDARAIATHLRTLSEVDARRVAFAEQVVREALLGEPEPGAMLDRAGLRLLAITLAGDANRLRLRYTAQKLPFEAARWLEEAAAAVAADADSRNSPTRELLRAVARDTELVAAGLHRGRRKQK
jgi:hypothetical protein